MSEFSQVCVGTTQFFLKSQVDEYLSCKYTGPQAGKEPGCGFCTLGHPGPRTKKPLKVWDALDRE